jgi:hypothetical protein
MKLFSLLVLALVATASCVTYSDVHVCNAFESSQAIQVAIFYHRGSYNDTSSSDWTGQTGNVTFAECITFAGVGVDLPDTGSLDGTVRIEAEVIGYAASIANAAVTIWPNSALNVFVITLTSEARNLQNALQLITLNPANVVIPGDQVYFILGNYARDIDHLNFTSLIGTQAPAVDFLQSTKLLADPVTIGQTNAVSNVFGTYHNTSDLNKCDASGGGGGNCYEIPIPLPFQRSGGVTSLPLSTSGGGIYYGLVCGSADGNAKFLPFDPDHTPYRAVTQPNEADRIGTFYPSFDGTERPTTTPNVTDDTAHGKDKKGNGAAFATYSILSPLFFLAATFLAMAATQL